MSTLDVSAIRLRVVAAISGALAASGWRETKATYDQFGTSEGEGRFHKGFAVGTPLTTPRQDRQRRSLGALSDTDVRVRWAYQLGAMKQTTSYDEALAAEASIRKAIATIAQGADLHLTLGQSTRAADDQGWVTGEMVWTALHHLPLE